MLEQLLFSCSASMTCSHLSHNGTIQRVLYSLYAPLISPASIPSDSQRRFGPSARAGPFKHTPEWLNTANPTARSEHKSRRLAAQSSAVPALPMQMRDDTKHDVISSHLVVHRYATLVPAADERPVWAPMRDTSNFHVHITFPAILY